MGTEWWKESVVYQIYPRSFKDSNGDGIGDIPGILSKLKYLKLLGVDVVWLSPVYKSPNDDNGYDISNYQMIMDDFGTMRDWETLLEAMHQNGIRLVMDLVVNHTSDEHSWFVESRKSKDNLYRDYYIWRPAVNGKEPTDWRSFFGGSAWEYDKHTGEYYLHLFSKKQPDLNWENNKLRNQIYGMMKFWLDKGIDGFRMDVINMISKKAYLEPYENFINGPVVNYSFKPNAPRVHDFLKEMNQKVLSKYDIMTVGECPDVTPDQAKRFTKPDCHELNMVFQFEHMDLDHRKGKDKWDIKQLDLMDLKENLSKWQTALHNNGWNSLYWGNHDQPRIVSRFGNDTSYRVESAKMLGTLLHMMQGTPYIYQGEEIGMTNIHYSSINDYKDIETLNMYEKQVNDEGMDPHKVMDSIYAKSRDNARTPMQWDDTKNAGFTSGNPWIKVNPNYKKINVKQALSDNHSIFYYYQKLVQLRKQYKIIVYGDYRLILRNEPHIFAYLRTWKNQRLLVVCNFYGNNEKVMLPQLSEAKKLLISNYVVDQSENIKDGLCLKPYECRVYLF
ncbi:glycoside hydrolase family 13 protein [Sporolactobacillus vineae]|uniref:glycoside hydrolase family 13 protein n=1 Tax=Sporolactobacillus vineae TaxID=444463 RepID=UPI0002894E66|nr:alpha-glucosidase [Sporolactobacillus vineae]